MYNNIIPNALIEGSSTLDITFWILRGERIPIDLKEKTIAAIHTNPALAVRIVEKLFDFTAEAFINRLQEGKF